MTVRRPRGRSTSMFFRLCWRAPRMRTNASGAGTDDVNEGLGGGVGGRSGGDSSTRGAGPGRPAARKRDRLALPWASRRSATGGRRPALARSLQPNAARHGTPVARHDRAALTDALGELPAAVEELPFHAPWSECSAQRPERVFDVEVLAREDVHAHEAARR